MNKFRLLTATALLAMAFAACDEETLTIGSSLTEEADKLSVNAIDFDVATRTYMPGAVLATASDCYLGKVKDPETGATVTSEFTTQFHLLEDMYVSPEARIVSRFDGVAGADSCDLILYLSDPFKTQDSLTAMKMRVLELGTPADRSTRYYSNFDPISGGMVRTDGLQTTKVYTYENLNDRDSLRYTSSYLHNVRIPLNMGYTATDGSSYNNYGTYILQQYYQHPEYFNNSYAFAHHVCPGFFFKITDGLGLHTKVTDIGLRVYYRVNPDSVYNAVLTLAGTKEVTQTVHVTNDADAIQQLYADNTCTYLKTPSGLFTEVELPVSQIRAGHDNDSLVGAKIVFQRLNNNSTDNRQLGIPQTLLMVQKDSLETFFENNNVPDSKTSYYCYYNYDGSTTSNTNTYRFNNISALITELWRQRTEGMANNAKWEQDHPNWNKVVLVPVTLNTNSSTGTITNVMHDMSLSSVRLVGGSQNPHDPVKISVVYAKFKE